MGLSEIEARLHALSADDKNKIKQDCEQEIARFAELFAQLGNGALGRYEESILRTYLMAKATSLLPSDPPTP